MHDQYYKFQREIIYMKNKLYPATNHAVFIIVLWLILVPVGEL